MTLRTTATGPRFTPPAWADPGYACTLADGTTATVGSRVYDASEPGCPERTVLPTPDYYHSICLVTGADWAVCRRLYSDRLAAMAVRLAALEAGGRGRYRRSAAAEAEIQEIRRELAAAGPV